MSREYDYYDYHLGQYASHRHTPEICDYCKTHAADFDKAIARSRGKVEAAPYQLWDRFGLFQRMVEGRPVPRYTSCPKCGTEFKDIPTSGLAPWGIITTTCPKCGHTATRYELYG